MPVTIRSRLLLLVLSVLLPGVLGAAWVIASAFDAERNANESNLRDAAHELSVVVDRALDQRAAIAQVLSHSPWLDSATQLTTDQLLGFEQQARRALEGMAGGVVLRTADRVVLDTRGGVGAGAVDLAAALSATPRLLPLQVPARADLAHQAYAAVVQPVERDGHLVMNLLLTVTPGELQRTIDAIKLPAGWIGLVMDDQGTVVARQPGSASLVGRHVDDDLRSRLARAPEGAVDAVSLDGLEITGYRRLSSRGWSYIGAMPRERFNGLARRAAVQVTLVSLVLLTLTVAGAVAVSQRIVDPVQRLKSAAAHLQAGERIEPGTTGIVEYDEVTQALVHAAAAIADSRAELEQRVAEAIVRTRRAEQRLSRGQRVEALGRLTGGVAHDFNNLLGVISNSAHLIGRHASAADLRLPLGATQRAVQSGQQLTQHLLRFAGRRDLHPVTVTLAQALPELLDLIGSALGRRNALELDVAADTAPVRVDAGELELALVNLALNARDAMPVRGTLYIGARNASADDIDEFGEAESLRGGPMVLITVSDEGAGFTPEAAARAFEPFYTSKPFGQSSGLGLSQVHGFCTQAGGDVRVASTPGLGSTVMMLLPAAAFGSAPAAPDAAPADLRPPAPTPSLVGRRVLLVEDNEALADVTAMLLGDNGACVARARNAQEAWNMAESQPFDVVLSDVVMPGEHDGLALARRLRQTSPDLAVVLISGYSEVAAAREFPFLRKPATTDELIAMLSRTIAAMAARLPGSAAQAAVT